MSYIRYSVIPITLLLLLATADARDPGPPDFETMDIDKDGQVGRKEFLASIRPVFDRIDTNRSDAISMSESRSFAISQLVSGNLDAIMRGRSPSLEFNADGLIHFPAVADALLRTRFDPVDTNRDRVLTRAEFDVQ